MPPRRISRRALIAGLIGAAGMSSLFTYRALKNNGENKAIQTSKNLRKVISNYSDIKTDEMAWIKKYGRPGKVYPAGSKRSPGRVLIDLDSDTRSIIHTHINQNGKAYPSSLDVLTLLKSYIENPKVKYSHIVSVNKDGEILGYTTLFVSRKLRDHIARKDPVVKGAMVELQKLGEDDPMSPPYEAWDMLTKLGLRKRESGYSKMKK